MKTADLFGPRWPGDWRRLTLAVVLVMLGWRLFMLAVSPLELSYDEAQYWFWSLDPDWGYYSKPPLIAWLIALSTSVCGDGEFCIRLFSPLCHAGAALGIFALGRVLFDERIGAWGAITYLLLPGVSFSSLLMTTDPPLLLFWAWAMAFLALATRTNSRAAWIGLGVCLGLGLLAKYAMVYFALSTAIWMLVDREARALLRRPEPWLAFLLGGLIYLPNLLWNLDNGMVTYGHTEDNVNLGGPMFRLDSLALFVVSQAAVFGPILLAALILLCWRVARRHGVLTPVDQRGPYRFLLSFCLPVLALITLQSFLSRAHANWASVAYVAGSLAVAAWLAEPWRVRWLIASTLLHLFLALAGPLQPLVIAGLGLDLPRALDPARRLAGWEAAGERLAALRASHPDARLVFDERKVMAALLYHTRPHPLEAEKWDSQGRVTDHYALLRPYAPPPGSDYLLVTRAGNPENLADGFRDAVKLSEIAVPPTGRAAMTLRVFLLRDALPKVSSGTAP